MKSIKLFVLIAMVVACSCTNNNHNTGSVDSTSLSTDPGMQGKSSIDSGKISSDSTEIRKPVTADTSQKNHAVLTTTGDSTNQ